MCNYISSLTSFLSRWRLMKIDRMFCERGSCEFATISRLPGTKTFPWIARRNARSHYAAQRNDRTLPVRHKAGLEANTESSIWRKTAFLHNFTEFRPVKRDRWRPVHDKSIPSTTLNVAGTDVLSSIDRSTKSIFVRLLLDRFKGYNFSFFFFSFIYFLCLGNVPLWLKIWKIKIYEWKGKKNRSEIMDYFIPPLS